MGSRTRVRSRGGPGPSARRWRTPVAALVLGVAALATSCGQIRGAHPPAVGVQAGASPSPAFSPNGENQAPPSGTVTYEVVASTASPSTKPRQPTERSPLATCPIRGRGYFADDFGAPRFAGGYHPHQGNDIFAAMGTPIVAPFDGVAVPSPNALGGEAVKVVGRYGYVYNAHLSGYGKTGPVRVGDVVGYVGNTGDALGGPPHDHFEWHPGGGVAVDPFPFLLQVCG